MDDNELEGLAARVEAARKINKRRLQLAEARDLLDRDHEISIKHEQITIDNLSPIEVSKSTVYNIRRLIRSEIEHSIDILYSRYNDV